MTVISPSSRNAPCACGSGFRYKHCCGDVVPHRTREFAQAAFDEFRLGDAERLFRAALAEDPDDVRSLHRLGVTLRHQLRYRDSLATLLDATERTSWQVRPLLADFVAALSALRGQRLDVDADPARLRALARASLAANDDARQPIAVRRTAIVVLGMHRSGTSALTRVLSLAGAELPPRLLDPLADNPRGFWESLDVIALNERLLYALGGSWLRPPGSSQLDPEAQSAFERDLAVYLRNEFHGRGTIVLKDPRMSLLAPIWRDALLACGHRPAFVVPVRDPLEVARSLVARDGLPLLEGIALWRAYMSRIEEFDATACDLVFLRSGDVLDDWRGALRRIAAVLDLELDLDAAAREASTFLDPALHRQHVCDGDWQALAGNALADAAHAQYLRLLGRCGAAATTH